MNNSSDSGSSKCLSGVLRLLLCNGSLQTHPSDQFIDSNTKQIDDQKEEKPWECEANVQESPFASSSNPGVVARLMGLDSFPVTPLPSTRRTLGSYFRSRSVDSIDFLSQFDLTSYACQHRGVGSSVSFREIPSLLHDKITVVLPFEGVNGGDLIMTKGPKGHYRQGKKMAGIRGKNREKVEERKFNNKPVRKMEMEKLKKSEKKDFTGKTNTNWKERREVIKPLDSKERKAISKPVKRNERVKKIHPEVALVKEASPSGAKCRNKQGATRPSNARRTHSSALLTDDGEIRGIAVKGKAEKKTRRLFQENADVTSWDYRGQNLKFEEIEDICLQFGQQILDMLLNQIIGELVLLYGCRN